jgi:protein-S-isoprenylcysteine O-methyltransferase Ste14
VLVKTVRPKLRPPVLFLLALLSQAALAFAPPIAPRLPWVVRIPGLLLLAAGLALTVVAEREFRRRGLEVRPEMPLVELVSSGPFRRSRNPMYLGLVVATLGMALLLASSAALVPASLLALALDRRVRGEELLLAARFGVRYGVYRDQVPRWL